MSLDMLKELTEMIKPSKSSNNDDKKQQNISPVPVVTSPSPDPNYGEDGTPLTILGFLNEFNIKYAVNGDKIDVNGDIDVYNYSWDKIEVPFGVVEGNVYFNNIGLTTFENFPNYVKGHVEVSSNVITSFKGCPQYIGGSFLAEHNQFTNIEGIAQHIGDTLDLSYCPQLTTLHNIHRYVKHVKTILLNNTPISQCIAGILLINGLESIRMQNNPSLGSERSSQLEKMINDYLKLPKNQYQSTVFAEELGKAGFEDLLEL